ncbi:MAG TPA: hypothetical protein VFP13_09060 [Actinomycetota bacterium]|jgi:hypothetical protein|nr:hypothetical protein [Actinomycetota bacterium]
MASKQLYEFLDVLVADDDKLKKFNRGGTDAQEVMDAEDLSAENQELLRSGSDQDIRKKLKDELDTKRNAYVIRMA